MCQTGKSKNCSFQECSERFANPERPSFEPTCSGPRTTFIALDPEQLSPDFRWVEIKIMKTLFVVYPYSTPIFVEFIRNELMRGWILLLILFRAYWAKKLLCMLLGFVVGECEVCKCCLILIWFAPGAASVTAHLILSLVSFCLHFHLHCALKGNIHSTLVAGTIPTSRTSNEGGVRKVPTDQLAFDGTNLCIRSYQPAIRAVLERCQPALEYLNYLIKLNLC